MSAVSAAVCPSISCSVMFITAMALAKACERNGGWGVGPRCWLCELGERRGQQQPGGAGQQAGPAGQRAPAPPRGARGAPTWSLGTSTVEALVATRRLLFIQASRLLQRELRRALRKRVQLPLSLRKSCGSSSLFTLASAARAVEGRQLGAFRRQPLVHAGGGDAWPTHGSPRPRGLGRARALAAFNALKNSPAATAAHAAANASAARSVVLMALRSGGRRPSGVVVTVTRPDRGAGRRQRRCARRRAGLVRRLNVAGVARALLPPDRELNGGDWSGMRAKVPAPPLRAPGSSRPTGACPRKRRRPTDRCRAVRWPVVGRV
jgi:hypothetical protein